MAKKDKTKPEVAKAAKPAPAKAEKPNKKKSKKGADTAAAQAAGGSQTQVNGVSTTTTTTQSISLSNMSPDQMTAAQIEQAIKESNDPSSRLRKLRSPLNIRSCLLNILVLIVVTFAIVILWCYLAVDKFNFVTVMSDMFEKFGITGFFQNLGSTIKGWFS